MEAIIKDAINAVSEETAQSGKAWGAVVSACRLAGIDAVNAAFKEHSLYSRASDAIKKGEATFTVSLAKARETGQNYIRLIKKATAAGYSFEAISGFTSYALRLELQPAKAENNKVNVAPDMALDATPLQEALDAKASKSPDFLDQMIALSVLADKSASIEVQGLIALAIDVHRGITDEIPPAILQAAREYGQ